MGPDAALGTIDATLIARGFSFVRPPAVYRGPIRIHGNVAVVEIEIGDASFARLPVVRLVDRSQLPITELAHLVTGGAVCYENGGLPLDLYNPGGSILRVLDEAAAALERSFGGMAATEFERELASYWRGNRIYVAIPRELEPTIVRGELTPLSGTSDSGLVAIPEGAWPDAFRERREPVTILNLTANLRHTAMFPSDDLRAILSYLDGQAVPSGWRNAVMGAAARGEYLLVSAPNAIIGWSPVYPSSLRVLRNANGFRPQFFQQAIDRNPELIGLHRVTGNQVDLPFCVDRNLAGRPSLIGRRVALVGCGTIGGYLARMLAQAGAGCGAPLLLYDTDSFSPGNLGRHTLGFVDLGRAKVNAVADQLRAFHPEVSADPRHTDATADWDALEGVELIIDATGEPNVATSLNDKYLRSQRTGAELALLHSFVFGNGVAAQSFLNLKDGLACYRCLKTAFDGQWRFSPLKDQSAELEMVAGTCGDGGYAPFSVDAPVAAAALALRAALDWAGGQPGKRLRTTIVDHVAGRDRLDWKSPECLPDCPACGGN